MRWFEGLGSRWLISGKKAGSKAENRGGPRTERLCASGVFSLPVFLHTMYTKEIWLHLFSFEYRGTLIFMKPRVPSN